MYHAIGMDNKGWFRLLTACVFLVVAVSAKKSVHVSPADHHDESPPLLYIQPAPAPYNTTNTTESDVKYPIREHMHMFQKNLRRTHGMAVNSTLLGPSYSLRSHFAGIGQGFVG